MISAEEWNARIDAFIKEENEKRGKEGAGLQNLLPG